jgi:hypothetical protein
MERPSEKELFMKAYFLGEKNVQIPQIFVFFVSSGLRVHRGYGNTET